MASGSTAPFSGEFVDLENVPKLPEGISAEQIFEQNSDVVRQVAEARHQAGLSQVNADGGFFDAFVDENKIQSKSGVRFVSNNQIVQLANKEPTIDDVESGSSKLDWEGQNSDLFVNTNSQLNGQNCLEFFKRDQSDEVERSLGGKIDDDGSVFKITAEYRDEQSGEDEFTSGRFRLKSSSGNTLLTLKFQEANPKAIIEENSGTTLKSSFTFNTTFSFEVVLDFTNNEADITVDSTTTTGVPFDSNADNLETLKVICDAFRGDGVFSERALLFDDYTFVPEGFKSSGAVTEQQFTFTDAQGNSFSPSKVGIFTDQTLNGQSISYDLKDSTGTVVKTFNQSDLNQLQSVNTTDDTFQIEANFSGNGSQTPELEFLDVRGV
jgi:hypothetical protein